MSRPALIALIGTVVIDLLAFAVSFTHLYDLAERCDVAIPAAWPLIVDLLILVSTVAVVAVRGSYAWFLLICGAAVSIAGNVADAILPNGPAPVAVAAAVAVVPPLALLAVTHLTVHIWRHSTDDAPALDEWATDGDEYVEFDDAAPVTHHVALRDTGDAYVAPTAPLARDEHDAAPAYPPYVGLVADPVDVAEQFRADTEQADDALAAADDDATGDAGRDEPGEESARDVAEQMIRDTDLSNRRIAAHVGVSEATIRRWRSTIAAGV